MLLLPCQVFGGISNKSRVLFLFEITKNSPVRSYGPKLSFQIKIPP